MVLLIFILEEENRIYAAFESEESGREFAKTIPGYRCVEEEYEGEIYLTESLDLAELPDYVELSYNGNLIPFSRFMFPDESDPEIIWQEIPNLDLPGDGLVDGAMRVDAYYVEHAEAKEYIEGREARIEMVHEILQEKGYDCFRQFFGSEDGEALYYFKPEEGIDSAHFMTHLDPFFMDLLLDKEYLTNWVEEMLED